MTLTTLLPLTTPAPDFSAEEDQEPFKFKKGDFRKGNHIVYNKEGEKYPALIVKCCIRLCKVRRMFPQILPGISTTFWQYDSTDHKAVNYEDIVKKIPTPKPAGDQRYANHYSISAMKEWWPDQEWCCVGCWEVHNTGHKG